jgi:hypothetical protein
MKSQEHSATQLFMDILGGDGNWYSYTKERLILVYPIYPIPRIVILYTHSKASSNSFQKFIKKIKAYPSDLDICVTSDLINGIKEKQEKIIGWIFPGTHVRPTFEMCLN